MISILEAEKIHDILIERFGGMPGIRDSAALQSALSRPFQTFDSVPLYPTVLEKAASMLESILNNHPFFDGNKRTGYVLTRMYLLANNYDISATQEEKYEFIIDVASGRKRYEEILSWLEKNTEK